jgi:hypothetical protein
MPGSGVPAIRLIVVARSGRLRARLRSPDQFDTGVVDEFTSGTASSDTSLFATLATIHQMPIPPPQRKASSAWVAHRLLPGSSGGSGMHAKLSASPMMRAR